MMVTGNDENSMKRTSRGRKPQYTLLVVFCLGELHVNELRRSRKKREIVGFTQTEVHDCIREYVDIKNLTIIKNAIYDAELHGWVAAIKVRRHGRDLFTLTKSGLAVYIILNDLLFNIELLSLYLENPGKARKEIESMLASLDLVLGGIISQLNLYKIIVGTSAVSPTYQKIFNRLNLLEGVRDAVRGYNREVPGNIETMRLYNIIKYLLGILKNMKIVGTIALCDAANRIIDSTDPLTWSENALG